MRKTFAYSSIMIGVLAGLLVYASTQNVLLGALVLIGIAVFGFIAIRFIEKLIGKGVDSAVDAAVSHRKRRG